MESPTENQFTQGPLGVIYLKTALPIIFAMTMSGLLSVADALFLGHYVGPEALAAVTLMFPLYMLIIALGTLVSNGMSSILARRLGAEEFEAARRVFAESHGLAVGIALVLMAIYLLVGADLALLAAGGSPTLAAIGQTYIEIILYSAPLFFALSINSDALRNEGRVGFMAALSLFVSLANILFNYLLIGQLNMGVAGSAYGTVLAQIVALWIVLGFRLHGKTLLRPAVILSHMGVTSWRRILALGAPQSLNFIGVALGSASIVAALQLVESVDYQATMTAYGILTRLFTFAILPLLGLSYAMQTITGNNFGAAHYHRSDQSAQVALWAALIYSAAVQAILSLFPAAIAGWFVTDAMVIAEVARIMPIIMLLFFLAGPMIIVSAHFQAIGDATRAAILGLSKPYLFAIPLTFGLALMLGEAGIWIAAPAAELLLLALTSLVLMQVARRRSLRLGLFHPRSEGVV